MNHRGEQFSVTQLMESDSLLPHQYIESTQMDPFPESDKSHLEFCHGMIGIHLPDEKKIKK